MSRAARELVIGLVHGGWNKNDMVSEVRLTGNDPCKLLAGDPSPIFYSTVRGTLNGVEKVPWNLIRMTPA